MNSLHFLGFKSTGNTSQAPAVTGSAKTKTPVVTGIVQMNLSALSAAPRTTIKMRPHLLPSETNVGHQAKLSEQSVWARRPNITATIATAVAASVLGLATYAGYRFSVPAQMPVIVDPVFSWTTAAVPAVIVGSLTTIRTARALSQASKSKTSGQAWKEITAKCWATTALIAISAGGATAAATLFGVRHLPKIAELSTWSQSGVGAGTLVSVSSVRSAWGSLIRPAGVSLLTKLGYV